MSQPALNAEAPAPAGRQRYLLAIWLVISVATAALGYLATRGFAPLVGVTGLLCLGYLRPRGSDWFGFGALALLAGWAAVSASWSPAPNLAAHSIKDYERLTYVHLVLQIVLSGGLVLGARRLQPASAGKALGWLGVALMVLAAIVVVEGFTQAGLYQRLQPLIHTTVRPDLAVRNVAVGGYVLVTLLWPVGAAMREQGRLPGALFVAAAIVFSTVVLRGDIPSIALALSLPVFLLVMALGRIGVIVMGALTTVYWLAMPLIMRGLQASGVFDRLAGHLPDSWSHRIRIWTFVLGQWLQDPVRGRGLDVSRIFPKLVPLHPHDGGLQIWFELGAPGAVLMAAFWAFLYWRIAKAADNRLFAAATCACATVYLAIGAVSFGLWQEWWVCLGALALAVCTALGRYLSDRPSAAGVELTPLVPLS